jgi:hypothetical protein
METIQGISLCGCLYLKQAKTPPFFNYGFSSTKLENRKEEQVLLGEGRLASVVGMGVSPRGGVCWGKEKNGEYGANNINVKMIPVETVPGIRREGNEREHGGGEFKYDIFNIQYIVRTFENAIMYPNPAQ